MSAILKLKKIPKDICITNLKINIEDSGYRKSFETNIREDSMSPYTRSDYMNCFVKDAIILLESQILNCAIELHNEHIKNLKIEATKEVMEYFSDVITSFVESCNINKIK